MQTGHPRTPQCMSSSDYASQARWHTMTPGQERCPVNQVASLPPSQQIAHCRRTVPVSSPGKPHSAMSPHKHSVRQAAVLQYLVHQGRHVKVHMHVAGVEEGRQQRSVQLATEDHGARLHANIHDTRDGWVVEEVQPCIQREQDLRDTAMHRTRSALPTHSSKASTPRLWDAPM